jgi:putative oxidoreductase
MKKILHTSPVDYTSLILRVFVGIMMLAHGLQKVGVVGDGGPGQVVGFMGGMGIPAVIAWLVIIAESVGALSLILGFLTRFCAASLIVVLSGAIVLVHLKNGFYNPGGFELHFLAIGMLITLVINGGGMYSVDATLAKK